MSRLIGDSLARSVAPLALACCAASSVAQNQLSDPSFETSTLGSYATVLNNFATLQGTWGAELGSFTGPTGGISPFDGSLMHSQSPAGGVVTQTVQVVDVSAFAPIAAANATFTMSAHANTANAAGATAQIIARFYSGPGLSFNIPSATLVASVALDASTGTWERVTLNGPIPAAATWMVFELAFVNSTMGGLPGFWDEAKFTLKATTALIGTGTSLPIPATNTCPQKTNCPTITTSAGGFSGQWPTNALEPWQGAYCATGLNPALSSQTGLTVYDFGTMPEGGLPAGSIFIFSDVDGGSGSGETHTLRAYDATGAQITTAWLDRPFAVCGSGSGSGGSPTPADMPGWSYAAGVYVIDGSTQTGPNPTLGIYIKSNTRITSLELTKTGTNHGMSICAPTICYADCNGDGVINIFDYICFGQLYSTGCP